LVKAYGFFFTQSVYIGNQAKFRVFIEAVFWMLRSGAQWRLLPECYGKWNSIFCRFNDWSKKGVFDALFKHISQDADLEYLMIDSTVVRAHACSAGYRAGDQSVEGLGRSCGGFTSKIHATVDALGNPLRLIVTEGNAADISYASKLISGYKGAIILGDKGYDSNDFIIEVINNDCVVVIPPKKNRNFQREYDKHTYKERHLVECFFGKIKHFRRVFSRFDKAVRNFTSFLCLACAHVWVR
jgi:transposase